MVAVTHLALLGVKIQDPAFWGHIRKMEKQSSCAAAFAGMEEERDEYKDRNLRIWKSGTRG